MTFWCPNIYPPSPPPQQYGYSDAPVAPISTCCIGAGAARVFTVIYKRFRGYALHIVSAIVLDNNEGSGKELFHYIPTYWISIRSLPNISLSHNLFIPFSPYPLFSRFRTFSSSLSLPLYLSFTQTLSFSLSHILFISFSRPFSFFCTFSLPQIFSHLSQSTFRSLSTSFSTSLF